MQPLHVCIQPSKSVGILDSSLSHSGLISILTSIGAYSCFCLAEAEHVRVSEHHRQLYTAEWASKTRDRRWMRAASLLQAPRDPAPACLSHRCLSSQRASSASAAWR